MFLVRVVLLLAAFCWLSNWALGQDQSGSRPRPPTGHIPPGGAVMGQHVSLSGRVLYGDVMRPAVRIQVRILATNSAPIGMTFTDGRGEFEFIGLSRATYVVEVSEDGYQSARERVELYLGSRRDTTILLEPTVTRTRNALGQVVSVRELKIPDKARKAFEKGVRALHEQYRPDRSLPYLQKAIELYPDFGEAYVQLGVANLERRNYPEAKKVLAQATQINPSNARAHMVLATVHNKEGQPQDAVEALQRALKLEPNAWQVYYELGKSFLQLGNVEEAYQYARRAHELNAELPSVHLLLYNLCIHRSDYEAAIRESEEFLTLFPANPFAAQLREKKDALRQFLAAATK